MNLQRTIGIVLVAFSFLCGTSYTGFAILDSHPSSFMYAGIMLFTLGMMLIAGSYTIDDKVRDDKISKLRKELDDRKRQVEEEIVKGTFNTDAWFNYLETVAKLKRANVQGIEHEQWSERKAKIATGKLYRKMVKDIKDGNMVMTSTGRAPLPRDYETLERLARLGSVNGLATDKLARIYRERFKPEDISKVSHDEGVMFLHALPHLNPGHRSQTEMNNLGIEKKDALEYAPVDFLKKIIKDSPMLSAYIYDERSKSLSSYDNGMGVILGQGSIYDASETDMASKGLQDGGRYRHRGASPGEQYLSLDQRIKKAIFSARTRRLHEAIIGKYKITGIYFEDGKVSLQEIRSMAAEAMSNQIQLYTFKEGTGFRKVDSAKYLNAEPKPL